MTEFEFLSVAASIMLALALGKLVSAIPLVLSRERFDWTFFLFFLFGFLGCLLQWRRVWELNSNELWRMRDFLLLMTPSIAFYLAVHILIPELPKKIENWGDHFAQVHRWFFVAILIAFVSSTAREFVFVEIQPSSILSYIFGVAIVLGIAVKYRIAHAGIGLVMVSMTLLAYWNDW